MKQGHEQHIANLESALAACRQELQKARAETLLPDTIIETSLDPITLLDSDGRIVRANPAFLKLLNCGPGEILQQEPLLLAFVEEGIHETTYGETITIDQAYYEKNLGITGRLFKNGKIENHEFYIARFDKKLVPVEGNFTLLRDQEGNRIGAFVVMRDITQHRLQAGTMKQARDFLENIFQTTDNGIFVTSYDGSIIRANRAFADILGYGEEELQGLHYSVLYTRKLAPDMPSPVQDLLMEKGSIKHYETTYAKKDGSTVDVEINLSLLKDDRGGVTGAVVAVRDITVRKQVETALRESEERFRALAMSAPEAIVASDSAGAIIFWNRGAENVFLYTEQEILGTPIHQLIVAEDRPADQEAFGNAQAQSRDFFKGRYFSGRGLRKNGSVFATEVSIGMWETQQGNYYIAIIRDVTQRQEMEEDLQRAHTELEKKVADRTATLEEVNTALRVLLKRREEDKLALEDKVLLNVSRLINPCLEKLKNAGLDARQLSYLDILEANLQDIVSPFLQAISLKHLQLTPMELEVANFIKHGHNTKKIAGVLDVSRKTVEFHRDNIRRKAGIKNKKINLRTFLLSLQ
ncbi:MAG: PAS domain S-box protein [Deltaproteobacteria bacterium]|nr:PAS domain S-box protein [Deltaproteobacteria bacterium]